MKVHVATLAVGLMAMSVSVGLQARGATELGAGAETAEARALLDQYCVACHNERAKAGSPCVDLRGCDAGRRGRRIVGKGRAEAARALDAADRPTPT